MFLGEGKTYADRYNLFKLDERLDSTAMGQAVVWLASNRADYITGYTLLVDVGGR